MAKTTDKPDTLGIAELAAKLAEAQDLSKARAKSILDGVRDHIVETLLTGNRVNLFGLGTFEWLADPKMALYAIAIADIWMWSPFVMLLSLAGLSAVPKHLYEAAAIDRASGLYVFFRITLPLVAPILMIAIIFRTMEAFKTFDLAYILASQPTTEVISIRLYKMAFQEWQTGLSSAFAYIVLVMVLAITNLYVKYLNKVKER